MMAWWWSPALTDPAIDEPMELADDYATEVGEDHDARLYVIESASTVKARKQIREALERMVATPLDIGR